MNFNKLSLEEKFGQMILLGLDVYEINEEIIKIIKEYKIGGVILYKKNYTSLETMVEVINKLKNINKDNEIPLFIGIEQENGRVNRFPKDIVRIYSAKKQSKTENLKIIDTINKITTYILASVGVNINFAPVLDVNHGKNKALGNRSYGKTVEEVIKYGLPFMNELKENGIISVIKHFPRIGATSRENLIFLPKTNMSDIEKNMKVFEKAFENGADAIMMSHIKIKGYGLKPATLNKKIIKELLIEKYSYKGLIITDDLRMRSLKIGLMKKTKLCIEAGNNAFLIKYKKGDINRFFKKSMNFVKCCEFDPELINNSAKKIVAFKKKYELTNESLNPKIEIDLINKKINKINNTIDSEVGDIL